MATKFEITIGEITLEQATEAAAEYFDAATIRAGFGLWEGDREDSVTVTVIGSAVLLAHVKRFAQSIAHTFDQDAVLVEVSQVTAFTIDAPGTVLEI